MLFLLTCQVAAADGPFIVGCVRATNINAYLNYMPLPTYNIDGTTVVILRDLENYGYVVEWDEAARCAYFYFDNTRDVKPYVPYFVPPWDLLQKLYDVYSSDVRVLFNGREIDSYNIGGRVAIKLRDIDIGDNIEYNDKKRYVSIVTDTNVLTGENYDYVMNYFYDNFNSLVEGDYYHSLVSETIKTNTFNYDYSEALVNFLDRFWKLSEIYKYYKEPPHFSRSADELWWAIVNERISTQSMYNLVLAMQNEVSEPHLIDVYAVSSKDSLNQRMEALRILKEEINSLKR